ncbi:MAG: 4Fe-4S dicluster domain-containing protein [Firmicutes bacterium]|nr:4Fe-4S dicluster domain-containing protein [Bacillota bacterium]
MEVNSILKKLIKNEELCTACGTCEQVCSETYFKEENREKASLRVEKEVDVVKLTTCSQCGECIELCPVEALYKDKNGVVRINKQECVGCFSCVGFCPEGAMFYHVEHIEPLKCIACGMCVKECPEGALSIEK